jgi:hypothetical protein
MTKFLALTTVFLAFLAFGCTDNDGPTQTVKSAYVSLEKNQTQDFVSLLSGNALDTYGTQEGVVALQRALSGLSLQVGHATLQDSDEDLETWSVPVVTTDTPSALVLTATVLCDVGYVNDTQADNCSIVKIVLN